MDWTGGFRGHTPAVLHPALGPRQLQRLRQPGPGTWHQAAPGHPGWRYNGPGYPAIEIAVYPDIIRLAAHNLRAHNTSHRPAP